MSQENCLTLCQFGKVKEIFKDCFEVELKKLELHSKIFITSRLNDDFSILKLHTILRGDVIKSVSENIFSHSDLTDFIFCLTDRFQCYTGLIEFSGDKIINTVINCFSEKNEEFNNNSLIPKKILANLAIDKDTALDILRYNKHYLTIILLVLFLHETSIYEQVAAVNKTKTQ
jgi:hypothetical protein